MALKQKLASLIDNAGLGKVFDAPAHDPSNARKPLLRGIANARKQFEAGQTKAPNRWWKVSNGVVALTVKVGGDVMLINGAETNHFPAERFGEFMDHFQSAVAAGEFDEELANHGQGAAKVARPKRASGLSPEAAKARGQKAAESRARNKAARAAAGNG